MIVCRRLLSERSRAPAKILKFSSDVCVCVCVCVELLTPIFKDCVKNSTFSDELKCVDVTSLSKDGQTNARTIFTPISVLPTVSKLLERIM